jgi:HEAT repeat protein
VEELLAEARQAVETGDPQGYEDAFLALLDVGEPAYAAVQALLEERSQSRLADKLGWHTPAQANAWTLLQAGKIARTERLGGLMDHLLQAGSGSPGSLQEAYNLAGLGVRSALPPEHLADLLMSMLSDEDRSQRWLVVCAVGALRVPGLLPELERLCSGTRDPGMRSDLIQAIGSLRTPEAVTTLGRLLEDEDPGIRRAAAGAIQNFMKNLPEAGDLLWSRARQRRTEQDAILMALSQRPDQADRVLGLLNEEGVSEDERRTIATGLSAAMLNDGETRRKAWASLERNPSLEELLLPRLADAWGGIRPDPKAQDLLLRRLEEDRLGPRTVQTLRTLPAEKLQGHQASLRRLACSPSLPWDSRLGALSALHKVDPQAVPEVLAAALPSLDECARISSTGLLHSFPSAELRNLVKRLAAEDPSEAVRNAARKMLERTRDEAREP